MLISCQFKYRVLVIGSESMTGSINRGDVVFIERYDSQVIKKIKLLSLIITIFRPFIEFMKLEK